MKKIRLNDIKNFIRTVLMNNFLYKALSLAIAVMAWLIIINVADPVTTKSFKGLTVDVINKSAISSINQVYEVVEGNTVDFTVKGKASIIKNLSLNDFTATADLSKLSPVYATDINVVCNKVENIEIDSGNKMLIVKLEDIAEKNMQVTVETTGDVAEGYYVGDYEVRPNMIMIAGGKSKIEQVDSVKLSVDVSGAKKSFYSKIIPVAYDKEGNELDSSYYTFYNGDNMITDIDVGVTIYNTKTLPVVIKVTGTPKEGFVYNNEYEYTPEVVTVGGSNKKLSKIDALEIPVDITGAGESYEINVDIAGYLPGGLKLVSEEENVSVRVKMDGVVSNNILVSLNDIEIRNLKDGLQASFSDQSTGVVLGLSGTGEQIDSYTSENVGAYIDLSNIGEGLCNAPVRYENVPDNLITSGNSVVAVNITSKNNAGATSVNSPAP